MFRSRNPFQDWMRLCKKEVEGNTSRVSPRLTINPTRGRNSRERIRRFV